MLNVLQDKRNFVQRIKTRKYVTTFLSQIEQDKIRKYVFDSRKRIRIRKLLKKAGKIHLRHLNSKLLHYNEHHPRMLRKNNRKSKFQTKTINKQQAYLKQKNKEKKTQ